MEINIGTKDTPIDVEVIIKHKNGKDVNLNRVSCESLLYILQEITNEFSVIQDSIETTLENKAPSGFCYIGGEKVEWAEYIRNEIYPDIR